MHKILLNVNSEVTTIDFANESEMVLLSYAMFNFKCMLNASVPLHLLLSNRETKQLVLAGFVVNLLTIKYREAHVELYFYRNDKHNTCSYHLVSSNFRSSLLAGD
jgi:hypothetical protein